MTMSIQLISRARWGVHALITGDWSNTRHYPQVLDHRETLELIKEDLNQALVLLHTQQPCPVDFDRGRVSVNEDGDVIEESQGWLCKEHGIIPTGTSNPPCSNGTYHCPICKKPAKQGIVETINLSGIERLFNKASDNHGQVG